MDSLTAQELKAVKEVKELAEEYGWKDDHHEFKDMLKQVRKKFKKEAGKMNKSTAQEAADEKKPTIKSWEHVAELTTKDFDQAKALMRGKDRWEALRRESAVPEKRLPTNRRLPMDSRSHG